MVSILLIIIIITLSTVVLVHCVDTSLAPSKRVFPRNFMIKNKKHIKQLFESVGVEYTETLIFSREALPLKNYGVNSLTSYSNFAKFYDDRSRLFRKNINKKYKVPIFIKWVNDTVGYGLFTNKNIKYGEYIIEYTGEIIKNNKNGTWAWWYPGKVDFENDKFSLTAQNYGNEARFANHSLSPNMASELVYDKNGIWHLVYIAKKDIPKGSQLLINYGESYWTTRESMVLYE